MGSTAEEPGPIPMIPFGIMLIAPILVAFVVASIFMVDAGFSLRVTSEGVFSLVLFSLYSLLGTFTLYLFMGLLSFFIVSVAFALVNPAPMSAFNASLWVVAFFAVAFWLFVLFLILLGSSGNTSMPYGAGG